jgi:hypothetical protein
LDAPCEELRQPTGHERMHSEPSLHPRGAEGGPSIAGESAFCGGVQTYNARGPRGGKQVPNPHYKAVFEKVGRERVNAFLGITEECRTAVFYCVREGLHKRPNLEVESDKKTVDGYLTKLGFGADMAGEPSSVRPVHCDMQDFIQNVSFPVANPRVMEIERIFWEKATAAHVYCVQGEAGLSQRFSRHFYDLARLDDRMRVVA